MKVVKRLAGVVSVMAALCSPVAFAEEPEIKRTGKQRIWYTASDLRAELVYYWAHRHLGDEWLVLKFSVAGGRRGVTQIAREDVRIRTPDGHSVVMPTQSEFRRVYGTLNPAMRREDVWGLPSSRFVGSLEPCGEWFYSPQGSTNHREIIAPSPFRYCSGPLVFQIPGGIQPGGWTLLIELEESTARIPFVLGEQ